MFYLLNHTVTPNKIYLSNQPLKTHRFILNHSNTLYSFLYPLGGNVQINSIFVFKKNSYNTISISLPLAVRFSKLSSISLKKSQMVLEKIISDLVYNFSFNTLYYFFKKLF